MIDAAAHFLAQPVGPGDLVVICLALAGILWRGMP